MEDIRSNVYTLTEKDLDKIEDALHELNRTFGHLSSLYDGTAGDPNEVLWMETEKEKWCGSFDEVYLNEFYEWFNNSLKRINLLRWKQKQKFRTCVEQVAQSEINNVDPMNLPMLVESLLERCWENDKEGFYKAYKGVINNEEGE